MKKIFLYASCIIGIVAIIGSIIFSIISENKNNSSINDKVIAEIEYLDSTIIEMMNKLNNIQLGFNINIERKEEKIEGGSKDEDSASENSDSKNSSKKSDGSNSEDSTESGSSDSGGSKGKENSNGNSKNNTSDTEYEVQDTPIMLTNKNNIHWKSLIKTSEQLYSSWTTIVIDLNSINISNENILNFGNNLDNLIINLKNNNKEQSLICLANMYSLLPEYINSVQGNSQQYHLIKINAGVLKAYATIYSDKWDVVNEGLTEANNSIESLINSELMLNNPDQNKIQEIYVLLKELTKTAKNQDKDMFLLKYVKLMEKMIAII